ncbi:hypothetical protein TARUN_4944 [Trichoderma arundinaceum]|uniref:Uncharacterized protein n=1 Tax=Trichoderma arundinaceum TaxID=490622 RepID=A0A395NML6_TRIAR|nr:hypothetical protein TARUN_4944 [Trichoderma arundinaceum]
MDRYVNEPWPPSGERLSDVIIPEASRSQASESVSGGARLTSSDAHEPVRDQQASANDIAPLNIVKQASENPQRDTSSSVKVEIDPAELEKLRNLSQWEKVLRGSMSESNIQTSRFVELCRLRAIEFELNKGDTLVFIDFPDLSRRRTRQTDCYGMAYSSQKLRVHSEKLLATGSSKFAEMLSPTYQFRIQRRRKLTKNLPEGVKYVLDLTPPSEGDDLVFQMTQLSLTPGIIKWWAANALHKVTNWLVSGHDDVCTCGQQPIPPRGVPKEEGMEQEQEQGQTPSERPLPDSNTIGVNAFDTIIPPTPHDLISKKMHGINRPYETPEYRNIPDYCPIRHCNNIIRLLMMIEGHDIMLDSANRVWTLVGLAQIFDCTSVVRDPVAQWIMCSSNTRFIEVLPEEALQIGYALELVQVTQCAFRILVNELALKEASTDSGRDLSRVTIFGRRIGNLDDELHNIVQHAARALVERVSSIIDTFQSEYSLDCWMVEEWVKLRKIEGILVQEKTASSVVAIEALRGLMTAIQNTIINTFNRLTPDDSNIRQTFISMDEDRATYVMPKDYELLNEIVDDLNQTQRLLCPFIYQQLGEMWNVNYSQSKWLSEASTGAAGSLVAHMAEARFALQQAVYANPQGAAQPAWSIFVDSQEDFFSVRSPLIDLGALNRQIHDAVLPYSRSWVRFDVDPPLNITRHMLLTLDNNELKFLPLWAGGCNDGTGGVFETELPPAHWGPNGPGPAYHTGITIPSTSSVSGSLADDFSTMKVKGSTVVGSLDAQDSISTVYAPGHVIADDVSIVSESFDADGAEYQEARFVVPADHQNTGHAVDMMVESMHSDADTASVMTDRVIVSSNHDGSGDDDVMSIDDLATQVIAQSDESDSDASTLEAWDKL